MATKTLFIESLNSGFVVTENGKTKAVEERKRVSEILEHAIISMTERLNQISVHNMSITITVDENVPTVK